MNTKALKQGFRDGIPIGIGYFAVSFALGIFAAMACIPPILGFVSSYFTRASAGEYGVYSTMVMNERPMAQLILQIVFICIIANMRYLLMGASLTQKFSPDMPLWKRIAASLCITDEIFALSVGYKGNLPLSYPLGATFASQPMWAAGTTLGIIAGNLFSQEIVCALSVALFGMFIAIFVPKAKSDRTLLYAVLVSFAFSSFLAFAPCLREISSGIRIVIATVVVSSAFAILKPIDDDH